MPPTEYPENMRALNRCWRCGGAHSTVRAMVVGMTPPRPRPARNRKAAKAPGLGATAHRPMATENQVRQAMSALRRPMRSVRVPTVRAPISMPVRARLPMAPTFWGVRPQGL